MGLSKIVFALALCSMAFGDTTIELMLGARDLPNADICCVPGVEPPDSYAKLYYAQSDLDSYVFQHNTTILNDNNNPDWPESFFFNLTVGSSARIKVEVYDSDIDADDNLGFAEFHLRNIEAAFGHILEIPLTGGEGEGQRLRVVGRINGTHVNEDHRFKLPRKVVHIPVPKAKTLPTITRIHYRY